MTTKSKVQIFFWLKLFYVLNIVEFVVASIGDNSRFYQNCVYDCVKNICNTDQHNHILKYLLGFNWSPWSCREDCQYECQWETVDKFQERHWPVPQFYGKWPFLRIFGLQEPASAIFSICNLLVVVVQWNRFRKAVNATSPYYLLWKFYTVVCVNAWMWSTVYHTRDTDMTERLDYMSASIMVFAAFFTMTIRLLNLGISVKSVMWAIIASCVLINHLAYLWFFKFDYTYNMLFNVIIGGLTVFGWIFWAAMTHGHPGRKTIVAYTILIALSTLLELLDFPPLLWTFDAHALWHFSTSFIVPLFFKFIREDCIYLSAISSQKLPTQSKTD